MTADLVAFLRARYDETATKARACPGNGEWTAEDIAIYGTELSPEVRAHMARHDPAHALADVDAKRAVVDAYEQAQAMKLASADNYKAWVNNDPLPHAQEAEGTEEMKLKAVGLSHAVRLLALPYVDHPDYREEWRP